MARLVVPSTRSVLSRSRRARLPPVYFLRVDHVIYINEMELYSKIDHVSYLM
jgi:hypothetical protein